MRGFPLINTLLILLALGLALVPLVKLTSAPSASATDGFSALQPSLSTIALHGGGTTVSVTVRHAHPPRALTVSHLGEEIWSASSAEDLAAGTELQMNIPAEGIDLLVHALWPPGTPESALEITLEPDGLSAQSRVLWGEEEIEDILTFSWERLEGS